MCVCNTPSIGPIMHHACSSCTTHFTRLSSHIGLFFFKTLLLNLRTSHQILLQAKFKIVSSPICSSLSSFIQIARRGRILYWCAFFVPTLGAILIIMASHPAFLLLPDKKKHRQSRNSLADRNLKYRSGYQDSNLGPPAPKAGALTNCATPRRCKMCAERERSEKCVAKVLHFSDSASFCFNFLNFSGMITNCANNIVIL